MKIFAADEDGSAICNRRLEVNLLNGNILRCV